ncbi:head-tail adaptor protein [Nioella sp.]|uniref:head-tail adaptor protein n=1 Tax=Nioella sp. TaxID=1912091 RepID=UPI0035177A59
MEAGVIGAGDLDRRIRFRRLNPSDDGISQVGTWEDLGSPVWARKRDVSDAEKAAAGSASAATVARFVVRFSSFSQGIAPGDAILIDGLHYDITGRKEIERRAFLEFTATARMDGAP